MVNIFVLCFISLCTSLHCVYGLCAGSCFCTNYTMLCKNGEIPIDIPSGITELYIEQFDVDQLGRNLFKNVSNIQKLDIQADHGTYIPSSSFDQFTNLTYLGLHGENITNINSNAFLGLKYCLTLNLSSNPRLRINEINKALDSENRGTRTEVLPGLISLSIAKVQTSLPMPVDLGFNFFKSVTHGRKLKHLDISDLNIKMIDFNDYKNFCKSVEYVNIRKSVIASLINFKGADKCESIRTVDLSEAIIPALRTKFTFETFNFFCESLTFFTSIEDVLANKIITKHNLDINNYILDMSKCPLQLKTIVLSGNKMKFLNVTVLLHNTTVASISEINVSYNELEYVSPSVLQPSVNMRKLDFSHNKLNVMQEQHTEEFERLFYRQTNLRYLNISHNSLSLLPKKIFEKSRSLVILDISYNRISSLKFSIKQLSNIERFIASHNKIHIIEENVRNDFQVFLQSFYNNITGRHGNHEKHFYVYLKGNPFQCTCDSENKAFIDWLYYSEVIDKNEAITCMLDDNIKEVRKSARKDTEYFCRIQITKKVAMITTPFVFTAILVGVFAFIRIRQCRIQKLRRLELITQIKMGTFPLPYLAFLSYCSEDSDLVLKTIYPEICKHMSEITNLNKQMVCIGDTNFRPGYSLICEIMRCVEESSVFVGIISKKYCQKRVCQMEIKEAYEQDKPIIMLMVEHVDKTLMDDFLQKIFDRFAHASWVPDQNGGHIEPEWKIFCKSIIQLSGEKIKHNI